MRTERGTRWRVGQICCASSSPGIWKQNNTSDGSSGMGSYACLNQTTGDLWMASGMPPDTIESTTGLFCRDRLDEGCGG